jgi:hypothetical protein
MYKLTINKMSKRCKIRDGYLGAFRSNTKEANRGVSLGLMWLNLDNLAISTLIHQRIPSYPISLHATSTAVHHVQPRKPGRHLYV